MDVILKDESGGIVRAYGVSFELVIPEGIEIDPHLTFATFMVSAPNELAALKVGMEAYEEMVGGEIAKAEGLEVTVELSNQDESSLPLVVPDEPVRR